MNGEIPNKVCERDNLHTSGDFGCYSVSVISCEDTCTRHGIGCFELTKDDPHTNGYFWSSKKLNVSLQFSVEVTINAGTKYEGAEGLVFFLQHESLTTVVGKWIGDGLSGYQSKFWDCI